MLCPQNQKINQISTFSISHLEGYFGVSFPLALRCPHDGRGIVFDRRFSQIGDLGIGILCNPRVIGNLFQRQPFLRIMLQQLSPSQHPRTIEEKGKYSADQIPRFGTHEIGNLQIYPRNPLVRRPIPTQLLKRRIPH